MFGWKPHLPIDLLFETNTADLKGTANEVEKGNRRGTSEDMTARSDV